MQVGGGGLGLKWLLANHNCQMGMKGLNLRGDGNLHEKLRRFHGSRPLCQEGGYI
jgi:hypothetical protein